MSERTWPEGVEPTPEQLADWLLTIDRELLVDRCRSFIEDMRVSARCFLENHAAGLEHLQRANRDLALRLADLEATPPEPNAQNSAERKTR